MNSACFVWVIMQIFGKEFIHQPGKSKVKNERNIEFFASMGCSMVSENLCVDPICEKVEVCRSEDQKFQ